MYLLNLSWLQFAAVFGSVAAFAVALYLLDRSRRKQVVSTLRFWVAAEQPAVARAAGVTSAALVADSATGRAWRCCCWPSAQLRFGAPAARRPRPRHGARHLGLDGARAPATARSWIWPASAPATICARCRRATASCWCAPTPWPLPPPAFEPDRRKLEAAIQAFAARLHRAQSGPGAGFRAPHSGRRRAAAPARSPSSGRGTDRRGPERAGSRRRAICACCWCPTRSKTAACARSACAAPPPTPTFGRSTFRRTTTAPRRAHVTLSLDFGPPNGATRVAGRLAATHARRPAAMPRPSFEYRTARRRHPGRDPHAARRLSRRRPRRAGTARRSPLSPSPSIPTSPTCCGPCSPPRRASPPSTASRRSTAPTTAAW